MTFKNFYNFFIKSLLTAALLFVALMPTWIFFAVKNLLNPIGFWQNFVIHGIGFYPLGGLQIILLFGLGIVLLGVWEK